MAVSLSGMTLHTNNDNESSWGGTDDADDYNNAIQGTNSESWQVSKNSTETGTLGVSSTLATTRGLFIFWMSSNLAPYYTDITLELESSNNNYKTFTVADSTGKEIGGNFIASAIDYVNKGTSTGTFAPASFSELRITVDNSSSGNIRSVINNWVDAMYYGVGHDVSGTTTGDLLFKEASAVDELSANKYGIMWEYNGIIYSQGDIILSGTSLVSDGEVLVFVDTLNGYDTYNLDVTGTVSLKNSTIIAAGTVDYNMDTTGATSFSMTGGSLTNILALTLIDGDTLDGVVLNNIATSSISNDPDGCTWNTSGLITLSSTGTLNNCIINKGIGTTAVSVSNLNQLDNNSFISDTTGHAVNLGTISSTQSQNWNNNDSSYASSDGSTGNEAILVSVNNGITLTINVGSGYSTPTIYNTGSGTVNVVSGQVTLTVTVTNINTGNIIANLARVYILADAGGSLSENTVIIDRVLTDANGKATDTRSYSSNQPIKGWVRKASETPFYKTAPIAGEIDNASGLNITIQMIPDQ